MSAVERPGISERWLKSVKKPGKQTSPYGANQVATYVADLNYFVVHGRSEKHLAAKEITGHEFEPTNPPQQGWEAYLPVDLHVYGAIVLGGCDLGEGVHVGGSFLCLLGTRMFTCRAKGAATPQFSRSTGLGTSPSPVSPRCPFGPGCVD